MKSTAKSPISPPVFLIIWPPRAGFSVQVLVRFGFASTFCGLFPTIPGGFEFKNEYFTSEPYHIITCRASYRKNIRNQDCNPGLCLQEFI